MRLRITTTHHQGEPHHDIHQYLIHYTSYYISSSNPTKIITIVKLIGKKRILFYCDMIIIIISQINEYIHHLCINKC